MRHILLSFLLFFTLIPPVVAQELTLQSQVRDAETGEPLPYASIYVDAGGGTLTNIEGDFRLSAGSQEVLTFSLVGYEKLKLKAADVPKIVRLRPLARALKEVVVIPVDEQDVVKQVINNLKKDFSKHKAEKQGYFMRTWMKNEWDSNLIECFMTALSAANLREGETLSGIYGMNAEGDSSKMGLYFTNIQKMTEIGPGAFMSDYWEAAIKPLYSHSMVQKYYDIELETLFGNEDEKLYRIVFKWKDKVRSEWHTRYLDERRHIIGTAYVDARTLRLLRFEGNVDNAYMLYNFQRYPNAIKFHASYDYADGFPAVSNLAIEGGNELLQYRLLMFNIQDDDLPYESSGQVGDNIIDVIENAGYDSTLWARFDIVKRTAEEERIAFGETLSENLSDENQPEVTISPEQSEEANPQVERPVPFGKTIPQEMVFVHMDNTCYFLGDTLFYKAYVQRSDTGKPTNLSEVLYVELLNQDGYLVERQVLRLKGGQANSSFCLEDTLYAGFYELRAYTRWQLNFGRKEHPHNSHMDRWFLKKEYAKEFFVDYDKLYSRVFPVYDKPKAPGEYYRDMTVRPLRRDYAPEKISRKPKVSLFPEGGSLIEGVSQRVAFEAKDGEGQYVEGRLLVLNNGGDTLCTAVTENRGRGCLELCLQRDDRYRALFEEPGGETTKVSLPDILPSGAAMKVEQDDSSIKADIQVKDVEQDSVMLLVTTCGRPRMQIPFEGRLLTVSKDSLPAGVAQLTLIGKGSILADRLVFVHKPDLQKAPLQITGLKQSYEPLEQVSLKVQGKVNSTLSVSVRDNVSSDLIYDNGNIMTEMLLSSHIKGFVENPGYFFEKDDARHRRHLDLLLMVQGWRRFDIKQPEIVEPYEKSQMIVGEVCKYTPLDQEDGFILVLAMQQEDIYMRHGYGGPIPVRGTGAGNVQGFLFAPTDESPLPLWYTEFERDSTSVIDKPLQTYDYETLSNPMRKTRLHAEYVQPGATSVYGDLTIGEDGKFSIQAPHFGGYCLMHLAAANPEDVNKNEKNGKGKKGKVVHHQWLLPNSGEYPNYSIRVHRCYPHFVKPYEYYQQQFLAGEEDENNVGTVKTGDVTTLQEVKIKARRRILRKLNLGKPALVLDAYDAFNQIVDAGLTCAYFAGSMSFSNTLSRLLIGDMGLDRTYPMERRWDGRNISVSSIQLKEEQLKYNHLENLDKVYVYTDYSPRKEGSSQFYGSNQPSVTIDLHRFLDDAKRVTYRDRFIVLDGYNTSAEFYSPDYSQQTPPEPTDYRRTLYWNPNLQLGENGEATVTFYNNSRQTTLSVEAEGQAPDGTLLWNR